MSLRSNLTKAGLVGVTGAVLSVVVLGGMQPVPMLGGFWAPKALIHGVALAGSSVAAGMLVPRMTPYIAVGSPQLQKFNSLILEPLVLGGCFLAVESLAAPAAECIGPGGTVKELFAGAISSVAASYMAEGLGLIPTVLG